PEMDPYEEVAQQGHAPPLSSAYVLDLIELDEHVPVYVLKLKHPEYHVPSDDDIKAPLSHRTAMIRMRDEITKEDMPPQRRFVLTTPSPRCDVAESFASATA
nr:hypothetical protein [Tanacetum cinerariifolium]